MHWQDGDLIARAGVPNTLFIQKAMEAGCGGCEFLLGIPGNIGGSIAMNAGSHQQSTDRLLRGVKILTFDGDERYLKTAEVPFAYRSSGLRDVFILEGHFSLPVRTRQEVQQTLDAYRDYRLKTQDLHHASAGCMFKNPPAAGCASGKLIEDAGLKGKKIGNAQVSTKHANFIINLGGAKASDVSELIEEVRSEVQNKFGVVLEPEVRMLR